MSVLWLYFGRCCLSRYALEGSPICILVNRTFAEEAVRSEVRALELFVFGLVLEPWRVAVELGRKGAREWCLWPIRAVRVEAVLEGRSLIS